MSDFREIIYFWLAFGILAPVILSKFYISKGEKQKNQLRFTSLVFQLIALILFFFPWVETEGLFFSGFSLAVMGNWGLVAYGTALILSMGLVISRQPRPNIVGAIIALANSVWLFVVMLFIFPGTKRLTLTDVAPIVSVFMMLCNNVAVLLLWHQLQKGKKKR